MRSRRLLDEARLPFDDPDWLFELKYDGFRALSVIEHGRAQLISRNEHPFASFADLAQDIAAVIPNTKLTVLDGKVVCLDRKGQTAIQQFAIPPWWPVFLRIRFVDP